MSMTPFRVNPSIWKGSLPWRLSVGSLWKAYVHAPSRSCCQVERSSGSIQREDILVLISE